MLDLPVPYGSLYIGRIGMMVVGSDRSYSQPSEIPGQIDTVPPRLHAVPVPLYRALQYFSTAYVARGPRVQVDRSRARMQRDARADAGRRGDAPRTSVFNG